MSLPTLGRYELLAEIGQGGYATVYRARHTTLQHEVALKLLSAFWSGADEARARFIREAQTAAALSHPGIVRIDDLIIQDDGQLYIVMEYMPGGDLRAWMAARPKASWRERLELIRPIAEALDYAHARQIWHRDVKPSNILLDERGKARLGDFGLVHIQDSRAPHLTTLGSIVGTAAYMAPEQAEGKPVDGRADQYALAVVIYELLTGDVPFKGETSTSILLGHVTKPPPAPSAVNPALPTAVDDVLLQGLAKNPAERFASCSALWQALQGAFLAGERSVFRALLAQAEAALQAGDLDGVRARLEEARRLLPNVPELRDELGQLDEARRNAEAYDACAAEWQNARRHAQTVHDLDPAYPDPDGVLAALGLQAARRDPAVLRRAAQQVGVGLLIGLPVIALLYWLAFLWIVRP